MPDTLQIERLDGGVALLTIITDSEPPQSFTGSFSVDLQAAVDELNERDDLVGAVITSGRNDGFLAGARIDELLAGCNAGLTAAQVAHLVAPVNRTLRKLELGKPVVAAINGAATGAGFELCLACHHRVLADDAASRVGLTEIASGLIPGGGGTQRLPRHIGIARALPLMLEGRTLAPAEALAAGLVDELAPRNELVERARRWVLAHPDAHQPWDEKGWRIPGGAGALAPHASSSFGLGVARVRRDQPNQAHAPLALLAAVYEGTQLPMDRALAVEAKHFGCLVADPAARQRMRSG